MFDRRGFLQGLLSIPAIVPASSLMPLRGIIFPVVLSRKEWGVNLLHDGPWDPALPWPSEQKTTLDFAVSRILRKAPYGTRLISDCAVALIRHDLVGCPWSFHRDIILEGNLDV